jgi:D-threo-aldose 1-dehydrogenase
MAGSVAANQMGVTMDIDTPRRLGKSSLEVTPLGFGGGTIGATQVDNVTGLATVDAAWDTGVRFFDTAPWYGLGRSERRLGLALSGKCERESYRINTKVGKSLVPEPDPDESNRTYSPGGEERTPRDAITGFRVEFDYSYERITAQHADSLQRLGHSRVDSLTIHDIDYGYHDAAQIEAHLNELSRDGGGGAAALESLRERGAIHAIGAGCNLEIRNADSWLTDAHEDLVERLVATVDLDFLVVAGGYTLLETRALRRVLPLCEARNIGVIIAAPFASGWLVNPGATTYMYGEAPVEIADCSSRMQAICERHEVPLAAAAIQFPLAHPAVAAVIPGAKTPAEPRQNHAFLHTDIPAAVWQDFKTEGLLNADAPTP